MHITFYSFISKLDEQKTRNVPVMLQFDWLCDVCGCVMSPTSGIYWVNLGFINNY